MDFIKMLAKEYQVDGLVYYTLKFCDNFGVQSIRVKEEMKKEGVPVLHLESDYSEGGTEQLGNRIDAFLEMIA